MKLHVSERLVAVLMSKAGIRGLPGPAKVKRLHGIATADDLVHRKFHRLSPNELWITDITEHPTREGKIYCCAVMDTFSRKIVGWSIDNAQDSTLVVNALDMAIKNRQPAAGGIVHADHGVQFTSWAFTNKIRSSGLMPSFGTIGDCYDCHDGIVLVEHADRASQPEEMAHKARLGERDLRLHRDLPQPRASSIPRSAIAPQSNTRHSTRTTSSLPVSHHGWNQKRGAGQDVTYSCSRPNTL